jgi:hypothetical protein
MEYNSFYVFSAVIVILVLIVMRYFFSSPKGNKKSVVQDDNGIMLKEFAMHHFNELKKINPSITLDDDFPEEVFPTALRQILKTDIPSYKEKIDAVLAINTYFQQPDVSDVNYINKRIKVQRNSIFIDNGITLRNRNIEIQPVIELEGETPSISIYEGNKLIRKFNIEPLKSNPNLNGQYLHSSIRINANSSVQIDGIISNSRTEFDKNGEGIRFQPFFLSDKEDKNKEMRGQGMFNRGLHYSGLVSPTSIRLICVCDDCKKSFGVQFFHAGFSEMQYFYSSNSKETLVVPYSNDIGKVPFQIQKDINEDELYELENKLPKTEDGKFEYYNAFKCPHCYADFINFRNNKESRPNEYYVNYYVNQSTRRLQ